MKPTVDGSVTLTFNDGQTSIWVGAQFHGKYPSPISEEAIQSILWTKAPRMAMAFAFMAAFEKDRNLTVDTFLERYYAQ